MNSGAKGLLLGSRRWHANTIFGPYVIPYDNTAATFSLLAVDMEDLVKMGSDPSIAPVRLQFPDLDNRVQPSGPKYIPKVEYTDRGMPQAVLVVRTPDESGEEQLFMSQASFNPANHSAVSAPLVVSKWHPSCDVAKDNCQVCHAAADQFVALQNRANAQGNVLIVHARSVSCIGAWDEIVDHCQRAGAKAVLIASTME